jgi:hypothetical protein|tara:strand:- start:11102 stop:11887 length:786 start_codon:yes stop_codon:yes gene_type:complete
MSKKLPAIQFYTGDWLKDEGVNLSSLAAQGLWINMLCYMNASSVRGTLTKANGEPMSVSDLAHLVRIDEDECRELLDELVSNNVPSVEMGACGPMYKSRRMLADEAMRQRCAEGGRKGGGNPTFQNNQQRLKGSSSSSSLSTSTSSSTSIDIPDKWSSVVFGKDIEAAVDVVYKSIPSSRRKQPSTAKSAIKSAIIRKCESGEGDIGAAAFELVETVGVYYKKSVEGTGEFFVYPARWFNEERYNESEDSWNGREKARSGL